MKKLLIIAFLLLSFSGFSHEYYVSICQIEHNTNTNSLEISIRIFTDDIEKAIEEQSTEKLYLASEKQNGKFDSLLFKYIINHLEIKTNNLSKPLQYIGSEVDIENVWCYFQINGIETISELKIENTILSDTYPEHINLVNYKSVETLKSATLSTAKKSEVFTF